MLVDRRSFLGTAALVPASMSALVHGIAPMQPDSTPGTRALTVSDRIAGPLPHYWEECAGSDRAVVGLRAQWLADLEAVRDMAGIRTVRFHGLFNDEMGVFPRGAKQPNFLYVDMVFDAMVERRVRPFVELSFMPGGLASGERTALWYRANVTPPSVWKDWGDLVGALVKHCVERYGAREVRTWRFEVWNEPNLSFFWAGTQAEYFELYRHSVTAVKSVDRDLAVGGPATARAAWVADFLGFCASEQLPVDFVSTHVYPDDPQKVVFGIDQQYPYEEVTPRALALVRQQIEASRFPRVPLYLSEWSAQNPAFIAHTIKQCVGLTEMLSYWTFDNVYEELGILKTFFNSMFGLLGMRGIPRPSFNAFALLHRLGQEQVVCDEGPLLATRRSDGSLAILVWNLIPRTPGKRTSMGDPTVQSADTYVADGAPLVFRLKLNRRAREARLTRVDDTHGSVLPAYQRMGRPEYPTMDQIDTLKKAAALPPAEVLPLGPAGEVTLSVPPNGIALLEVR